MADSLEQTAHHLVKPDEQFPTCERTIATLAIYSVSMEPIQISKRLGVHPTSPIRKSLLPRSNNNTKNKAGKYVWLYETEGLVRSRDIRHHIDYITSKLLPMREKLLELQTVPDVTMTVWIDWWGESGGPVFWPKQLRDLALLNLELQIYVADYGPHNLND